MLLGLYRFPPSSSAPNSSFLGCPSGGAFDDPEAFLSLLDLGASWLLGLLGVGDALSIGSLWANLESAMLQSGRGLCCDALRLVVGRVRLF